MCDPRIQFYRNLPVLLYISGLSTSMVVGGMIGIGDSVKDYTDTKEVKPIDWIYNIVLGISLGMVSGVTWPIYSFLCYKNESYYIYEEYKFMKNIKNIDSYNKLIEGTNKRE